MIEFALKVSLQAFEQKLQTSEGFETYYLPTVITMGVL